MWLRNSAGLCLLLITETSACSQIFIFVPYFKFINCCVWSFNLLFTIQLLLINMHFFKVYAYLLGSQLIMFHFFCFDCLSVRILVKFPIWSSIRLCIQRWNVAQSLSIIDFPQRIYYVLLYVYSNLSLHNFLIHGSSCNQCSQTHLLHLQSILKPYSWFAFKKIIMTL